MGKVVFSKEFKNPGGADPKPDQRVKIQKKRIFLMFSILISTENMKKPLFCGFSPPDQVLGLHPLDF